MKQRRNFRSNNFQNHSINGKHTHHIPFEHTMSSNNSSRYSRDCKASGSDMSEYIKSSDKRWGLRKASVFIVLKLIVFTLRTITITGEQMLSDNRCWSKYKVYRCKVFQLFYVKCSVLIWQKIFNIVKAYPERTDWTWVKNWISTQLNEIRENLVHQLNAFFSSFHPLMLSTIAAFHFKAVFFRFLLLQHANNFLPVARFA